MIRKNLLGVSGDQQALESRVMLAAISPVDFDDSEAEDVTLTAAGTRSLSFDALSAPHYTPNGSGPRSELKIHPEDRVDLSETNETFSATVTPTLSDGTRTAISQYKVDGDEGMIVFVSDGQARGSLENNIPNDGVFDVYTATKNASGDDVYTSFGTIESGESFQYSLIKAGTTVRVSANGAAETFDLQDGEDAYFKFGNYVQAQDPDATNDLVESGSTDAVDELADAGITVAAVDFALLDYERAYLGDSND